MTKPSMTKPARGDTPTVIYVCSDFSESLSASLFHGLADYGIRLLGCSGVARLKKVLEGPTISKKHPAVVMIDGRQPDSFERTAIVRALYPVAGIVVLCGLSEHREVLAHMHAGADVWCPAGAPIAVVAAQLMRLVWRLQQSPGQQAKPASADPVLPDKSQPTLTDHESQDESSGRWWSVNGGWMIWTPEGQSIRLTPTERSLLRTLWQAPGGRATHATLLKAIQQSRNTASKSPAYPALVISRLRRKFLRKGVALPIQSVRSWGYMLTVEFSDYPGLESVADSVHAG